MRCALPRRDETGRLRRLRAAGRRRRRRAAARGAMSPCSRPITRAVKPEAAEGGGEARAGGRASSPSGSGRPGREEGGRPSIEAGGWPKGGARIPTGHAPVDPLDALPLPATLSTRTRLADGSAGRAAPTDCLTSHRRLPAPSQRRVAPDDLPTCPRAPPPKRIDPSCLASPLDDAPADRRPRTACRHEGQRRRD